MRDKNRRAVAPADLVHIPVESATKSCDSVKHVCSGLSVGEAVEEPAKIGPLPLGLQHELRVLKIAKVLLPEPGLLPHEQDVARHGFSDLVESLLRPKIRADVEHKGVGSRSALDPGAGRPGLPPPLRAQGYPPVGKSGEECFILIPQRPAVPKEEYVLGEVCRRFRAGRRRRRGGKECLCGEGGPRYPPYYIRIGRHGLGHKPSFGCPDVPHGERSEHDDPFTF
mmetsp:Transcript_2029/g.5345  ORF Transcript_2029/g.5345 Transcript_2029/m.5345 type:complete len:225 (-) Transcript_2029:149-823(-)